VSAAPHRRPSPLKDGFYWVAWDHLTMVAERLQGEWWLPGFDDPWGDSHITVIAGPISPPRAKEVLR
jgi:hypothetical protein